MEPNDFGCIDRSKFRKIDEIVTIDKAINCDDLVTQQPKMRQHVSHSLHNRAKTNDIHEA
jgi:hypothetical protein